MSRISFKEFSAGLPVTQVNPKAPRLPEQVPQGNMLGRILADAPSDIAETFKGVIEAGRGGAENITESFTREGLSVPQRLAGAITAPFSALVNAGGEVLKGGAKLFTTDEFEQATNEALAAGGRAAMSSELGQKARAFYENLPDDQKFMLTNVIGPTANVMTAGVGGGVGQAGVRGTKAAIKNATAQTVKRTAAEAADDIVRAANPVVEEAVKDSAGNAVVDTIKGAGEQIKTFLGRTAREAQDTATESRRLSQMPAPKATLIKNGADERVVNVIDKATPEEVKIYRELVDQAKKKELDPTPNTPQPKVIAGREFLKPVQYIIDERKKVGQTLGEYRKNLSKTREIDTNPAFRNFHEYLVENYGVKFDKEGKIRTDAGTIATSDIPQVQKLYDALRSDKKNSQVELDQWLQRTYKDYDLIQKREKTFSEEVPRIAEYARSQVRQLMPEDYNQLATDYARLSKPLNDFTKLIQYKGSLDELTTKQLKTGEVALRVLGNAADRPQSVIDGILETATANGYTSTVDLNRLIYVTDQLEDLYDITPTRGFSGSATRGINQSSVGAAADAATLNLPGLFDRAMNSRASQKEIQQSFEAYLKYLDEGGEPGNFKSAQTVKTEQSAQKATEEQVRTEVQSMIDKAPEAKQHIDQIADDVSAGIPNVRVAKTPIKSVDRAVEKVIEEESGNAGNLRDLARNSLVPMDKEALTASLAKMDEILQQTKDAGLYARKKVQTPEKFSGYGGVIYNIETPNGLIAEIQVVEPRMIFGKMLPEDAQNILGKDLFNQIKTETGMEPGYGHKLYEDLRKLSIAELEGPKGQALIQESVDYYNKLR